MKNPSIAAAAVLVLLALVVGGLALSSGGEADAGEAARDNAVTTAFGQVLAQVAGRAAVATLAQQPAGRRAAQGALLGFATRTGDDGTPLIEARFEPAAVRTFLDTQHVAAPPDRRPTLLLWLLLDGESPTWVGADEPPTAAGARPKAASKSSRALMPA